MKPAHVTAFCPGHISGYFKRIVGDTVATTGSIGAGIVISEGVNAIVEPAERISICIKRRSSQDNHLRFLPDHHYWSMSWNILT
jgi:pantoate kinase